MSYQINWKFIVQDLGLTEDEVKRISSEQTRSILSALLLCELNSIFPDLEDRMLFGLGHPEVVFLRDY